MYEGDEKPAHLQIIESDRKNRLIRDCAHPDLVLVAKIDDLVVGAICSRQPDKLTKEIDTKGYLGVMYIKEEYKGQGIDEELFLKLLHKVKEQGKTHLCIEIESTPIIYPRELVEMDWEAYLEKQELNFSFFYQFHMRYKVPLKLIDTIIVSKRGYNFMQIKLSTLQAK